MTGVRWGFSILFSAATLLFFAGRPGLAPAQDSYSDWLQGEIGEFQDFKDRRDKEFVGFLKKEWLEFRVERGLIRDPSPKPVERPVARDAPVDNVVKPAPGTEKVIKEINLPKLRKTEKPNLKNLPALKANNRGAKLEFDFFKTPVHFRYDDSIKRARVQGLNKKGISSFWKEISNSNYEDFLTQLKAVKEEMLLNDWGNLILIERTAKALFPDDPDTSTLFVWFIMTKTGYDTRVGYNEKRIFLLLPSETVIYETPNFRLDGTRFYATSLKGSSGKLGSIYTYKGDYPGANRKLNLTVGQFPRLNSDKESRELKFEYAGQEFKIDAEYNRDSIEFFRSYPQTDLEVYFNSSLSPEASYSLLNGLKPLIEGKGEFEAVNIILRFVQTAFEYQTDGDQFGREKYFFREETLFYPFSDCEDRSILFAYLVKELTGLHVIVLDFPGHIATAVKFNEKIKGDSITFNESVYLICDPTYLNANVGMKMRKFKNVEPKVIGIKM